jgi:hypothetical protein
LASRKFAARVGRARWLLNPHAAPPKGHTRKLSGKRTDRVEKPAFLCNRYLHINALFFALWRAAVAVWIASSSRPGKLPTEGARVSP